MTGMLARRLIILLLSVSYWSWGSPSSIIAKVNGEPVFEAELKDLKPQDAPQDESPPAQIDRLIGYHLALQDARKRGLDQTPEYLREANRLLYRHYLDQRLATAKTAVIPSEKELSEYYDRQPIVRLRHLVVLAKTDAQKQSASKTLARIQSEQKRGTDFKTLVTKYSQDEGAQALGDLDLRGADALPPPIYQAALKLKKGEISAPIEFQNAYHLIQLTDRKTFDQAPVTYQEYLKHEIQSARTRDFLNRSLDELKRSAQIEITKAPNP
jgi:parvulin-like peptidyl-prolyl isomerase